MFTDEIGLELVTQSCRVSGWNITKMESLSERLMMVLNELQS